MEKNSKIMVLGHKGMVGSAIIRNLYENNFNNIITDTLETRTDLTKQSITQDFICNHSPDYIFLAAAKVGGIHANNTFPAEFIYNNLTIQNNIIEGAHRA